MIFYTSCKCFWIKKHIDSPVYASLRSVHRSSQQENKGIQSDPAQSGDGYGSGVSAQRHGPSGQPRVHRRQHEQLQLRGQVSIQHNVTPFFK